MRGTNAEHRKLQAAHLDKLIEERLGVQGTSVKAIRQAERLSHLHKRFNMVLKPPKVGINELKIKTITGEDTLAQKKEIDRVFHLHNAAHFAEPTTRHAPFSNNPLLDHFGLRQHERQRSSQKTCYTRFRRASIHLPPESYKS